jgi:hypothetical protein
MWEGETTGGKGWAGYLMSHIPNNRMLSHCTKAEPSHRAKGRCKQGSAVVCRRSPVVSVGLVVRSVGW